MNVELPDGTVIEDVPEGTTKEQLATKLQAKGMKVPKEWLPKPKAPERTTGQKIGRQLALTARAGIEGVTALPGMLADAPFQVANLFGANMRLPSQAQANLLNQVGFPQPENATERIANMGTSAMAGTGATVKLANLAGATRFAAQPGMQVLSAGTGGVSAQAAKEEGAGPVGTTLAGIAGSLAPYAAAQVGSRVLKPVGSFKTDEQVEIINQAKKQGFKLTAGQETGNERMQAAESTMRRIPGGGEIQRLAHDNWKVLNRNALRSIGESGDAVTPSVLSRADDRIGSEFERITRNANIRLGDDFIDDLARVEQEHVSVWNKSDQIKDVLDKAVGAATKGELSGQEYMRIRSSLQKEAVAKITAGDANTGQALGDIAEALDNAAQRSLSDRALADLKTARREWRNLLTLYDATTANIAGKSGAGNLDPGALVNAVVKNRGRRVFAKSPLGGGDELADLARTATSIRDLIPSSGTAERMFWMNALTGGGGSVLGATIGGSPGAAIGYAGGLAAPYVATKTMMSDPVQQYLKHGFAPGAAATLNARQVPLSAVGNVLANDERQ